MEKEISYLLNKKKIISRMFLQAILVVFLVFLFIYIVAYHKTELFLTLFLIPVLAFQIASSLLFASAMALSKSPGLIVGPDGIVDNTTGVSAGKVSWDNIAKISVTPSVVTSFLTIEVLDPEQYLKQGNLLSRFYKKINYTFFKSPIHISAHALDIGFNEMAELVEKYYSDFNQRKG